MTILTTPTPALDVCRWALRQPILPREIAGAAVAVLSQSPEWTDVALAREYSTAFWSSPPPVQDGDNFRGVENVTVSLSDDWLARLVRWDG